MAKNFVYNRTTGKLHYLGLCPHAKITGDPNFIYFSSEDEALAYDGRAVGWCKTCFKKREKQK